MFTSNHLIIVKFQSVFENFPIANPSALARGKRDAQNLSLITLKLLALLPRVPPTDRDLDADWRSNTGSNLPERASKRVTGLASELE